MPKWLRNLLLVIIALVILVPVAGYIALSSYGVDKIKGKLLALATENTGRNVELDKLSVAMSLVPTFTVEGLRVANPAWAKEKWLTDVASANITVDAMKLLDGTLEIKSIKVDGAKINPEVSAKGEQSWELKKAEKTVSTDTGEVKTASTSKSKLVLTGADIKNLALHYNDAQSGTKQDVTLDNLAISSDERWTLEGKGRYQGLLTSFRYISGSKDLMSATGEMTLKITNEKGGFDASVEGALAGLTTTPSFKGDVSFALTDASALKPWVKDTSGIPLPLKFGANVNGSAKQVLMDNLKANVAGTDISGSLSVANQKPLRISGKLAMDKVPDLGGGKKAASAQAAGAGAPAAGDASGRVIPATPLHFAALKQVALDLTIALKQFPLTEKLSLSDISARITSSGNQLSIAPVTAQLAGKPVSASVTTETSDTPQLSLTLKGDGLPLKEIAAADEIKSGSLAFALNFSGRGGDTREWLGGANGNLRFDIADAQIVRSGGGSVSLATQLLLGDAQAANNITISCGAGRWSVAQGVARPDVMALNSSLAYVEGKGEVNLRQEAINLNFIPYPRKTTLANIVVPIKVQGNFAKPQVGPDKAAATKAVGSIASQFIGDKKIAGIVGALSKSKHSGGPQANPNNPCYTADVVPAEPAAAPAATTTEPAAPGTEPAPATAEPQKPKKLKDELKENLGKGLQNFLSKPR